jgi:D-sedoheptulose 7-phosphate isomerase
VSAHTVVFESLQQAQKALNDFIANAGAQDRVVAAANCIAESFRNGGRVFSCGNGGSMCDAIHFAEELSGRYRDDRKGLPAVAIADPGHLTCVGNDYGYDFVFSRYLEAHARKGDVLVGISTSGKSRNVIRAAEKAREIGVHVIVLNGKPDSELGKLADIEIITPGTSGYADRVQELHIKVIHILIELVERAFYPENYAGK